MPQNPTNILSNLPRISAIENARKTIHENYKDKTIVVLDDDPTGCQTVHGIHVLFQWDELTLANAIKNYGSFYILHNTRSLSAEEAFRLNTEISTALLKLIPKENLIVISRSDSTLRGHFLPELTALIQTTGPYDGIIVVPFFKEGGRLTIEDEHYVAAQNDLVPAEKTEFAHDPVFGFSTSNLPKFIEEKTEKALTSQEVLSISLDDIRIGGIAQVTEKLSNCSSECYVVVNAVEDEDLDIVVLALQEVQRSGKRFLFRSAASLVKVILGLEDIPLWRPEKGGKRGVIIAGSHVKKTSDQLKHLMDSSDLEPLILSIHSILEDEEYFSRCIAEMNKGFAHEKTMLISTERKYKLTGTDEDRLVAGRKISDFLSGLINYIETTPDFIVAKGGITSNDVAKYGLEITDAEVLGQIQPGIPVWKPGPESKFPDCTYVVFPGNVGQEDTLSKIYQILTQAI